MNHYLKDNIENIFKEINSYIFTKDNVDLEHIYIDGTKMEANANKYSWVWKNACLTSRIRLYKKINTLLLSINEDLLSFECYRYSLRDEYSIEYLELIISDYEKRFKVDKSTFVSGKGHKKSLIQRYYDLLISHFEKGKVLSMDSEDKRPLILPTPNPLPNINLPNYYFDLFIKITYFLFSERCKENKKEALANLFFSGWNVGFEPTTHGTTIRYSNQLS